MSVCLRIVSVSLFLKFYPFLTFLQVIICLRIVSVLFLLLLCLYLTDCVCLRTATVPPRVTIYSGSLLPLIHALVCLGVVTFLFFLFPFRSQSHRGTNFSAH